jgi:hypothetical protein
VKILGVYSSRCKHNKILKFSKKNLSMLP